jgi:hypothetical protein
MTPFTLIALIRMHCAKRSSNRRGAATAWRQEPQFQLLRLPSMTPMTELPSQKCRNRRPGFPAFMPSSFNELSLPSFPKPRMKLVGFTLIRFDSLGSPQNPPAKMSAVYFDHFDSLGSTLTRQTPLSTIGGSPFPVSGIASFTRSPIHPPK